MVERGLEKGNGCMTVRGGKAGVKVGQVGGQQRTDFGLNSSGNIFRRQSQNQYEPRYYIYL